MCDIARTLSKGKEQVHPVSAWISVYGEDAKPDMATMREELVARLGEERAKRVADTNRNLVIFPNLVIKIQAELTSFVTISFSSSVIFFSYN